MVRFLSDFIGHGSDFKNLSPFELSVIDFADANDFVDSIPIIISFYAVMHVNGFDGHIFLGAVFDFWFEKSTNHKD